MTVAGLKEISYDEVQIGDAITVTFVNAGHEYFKTGTVAKIDSRRVRNSDERTLVWRGMFTSKYYSNVRIYRGLPTYDEPTGYGAIVKARPKWAAEGRLSHFMKTPNIDPKTFVNGQVWMQIREGRGKPYMVRWDSLVDVTIVSHGIPTIRLR